MDITQEEIVRAGYNVKSAPVDAWRVYDEQNPVPGYFDFDWFSSRHPDLYHKFALSTDGLMEELNKLIDLAGLHVLDIGAGTGRSTIGIARKAKKITTIDVFASTLYYGRQMINQAGFPDVTYSIGHSSRLPFGNNTFEAVTCAWSILDYAEAYRVVKPGGYIIELICAPGALCGELTATLAGIFPTVITEIAPDEQYDANFPDSDTIIEDPIWNGLPVISPTLLHDFTYVTDYGDCQEIAAMIGRLYGPVARQYLKDRQQSTLAWRLRISISRARK